MALTDKWNLEKLQPVLYSGQEILTLFDNNVMFFYIVVDKVSNMIVSEMIPARNDFIALQSFCDFKKKKESEKDGNNYQLQRVGFMDLQNNVFWTCVDDGNYTYSLQQDLATLKDCDDIRDYVLNFINERQVEEVEA